MSQVRFLPALVLILQVCWSSIGAQWVNDWDKDARIECTGNQILDFLGSVHNNYYDDRRWQFQCRPSPVPLRNCSWTGFLNEFDAPLMYSCGPNEVLNGMYSINNNHYEDRRFQLLCCRWFEYAEINGVNCQYTNYINDFDKEMTFNVPDDRYIRGVSSVHDNYYEDRRWKIQLCDI